MSRRQNTGMSVGVMVGGVQLDLFGQVEEELDTIAQRRAQLAATRAELERRARFHLDGTEVRWVAPWDCSDGMKKGEDCPGWRCWLCGQIEVNEYLLSLNHGIDEVHPDSLTWTACTRQGLLASQARAEAERLATYGPAPQTGKVRSPRKKGASTTTAATKAAAPRKTATKAAAAPVRRPRRRRAGSDGAA